MASIDELKRLLAEDLKDLDEMIQVLTDEKTSLKGSDMTQVEPLTQRKNVLLEQVRARAKRKIHVLVDMGYRPDLGEPSVFIRAAGQAELTRLWSAADTRLKTCQQLNSVNGRIVGHLQRRLGRLTDIFRGTSGQAKLYGASGEQTSLGSRTILASA